MTSSSKAAVVGEKLEANARHFWDKVSLEEENGDKITA